jgi:hypothetical protein
MTNGSLKCGSFLVAGPESQRQKIDHAGLSRTQLRGFCSDLKCQSPLTEQNPIRVDQRIARIVDVGRFTGDAVELDDLQILAQLQIDMRWYTDVKTSEIETLEAAAYLIDLRFQSAGFQPSSVQK